MLELKNIKYDINGKVILEDINLVFNDSEITVITGQNGSGKTTLLKIIMGILHATSGKILLNGKDITSTSISERTKLGLAYSFQQPVKFKGLTVKDLIEIADNKSVKINDACDHLCKVGLCARSYLDREFNDSLSGGERKRIEIALTLARGAQTNLFDEPEAGIDMWSFDNLTNIFNELKDNGKTVVIVSHQEKIMQNSDKIIVLNNTKVDKFGKTDEILASISPALCIKLKGGNNE